MMKRADMGDYPVAALLLLGRRGLGHWCQTPVHQPAGLGQGSDTGVQAPPSSPTQSQNI